MKPFKCSLSLTKIIFIFIRLFPEQIWISLNCFYR